MLPCSCLSLSTKHFLPLLAVVTGFLGLPVSICRAQSPKETAAAGSVVSIAATNPSVFSGIGDHATVTVTRTGDTSEKLVVSYSAKGSAKNGTDYVFLARKVNLKAGKASAKIRVVPMDSVQGHNVKTVRLTLKPNPTYQLGADTIARVSIIYTGK